MIRVGVLISGRGSNMVSLVRYSERDGRDYYRVICVVSHEEVEGILEARRLGVPTEIVEKEAEIDTVLREYDCDLIVLAGYTKLLSKDFVDRWCGKIINVHPSLLPDYKGLDTHRRVLEDSRSLHGCSVHWVSEGLDEGEVIANRSLSVREDHTSESIAREVLELEHELLPSVVCKIAKGEVQYSHKQGSQN